MLNFFIYSLIVISIGYIAYTYTTKVLDRSCDKVEFRYKPQTRTFKEEQMHPVSPFGLFQDLFHQPDPWWSTTTNSSQQRVGAIQPATWVGLPKDKTIREGEDPSWENTYFN